MRVVLARKAIEDLVAIGEYIAASNPERAESFVNEIQAKCFELADSPKAFARLPHRSDRVIRRRPFGQYLIFYEMGGERIEILRVIHGARDYQTILFSDD
jgi:toxin ParE1/3/4